MSHMCLDMARRQVALGAVGLTWQPSGEAEILNGASTTTARRRPPPPAAHRAFVTSAAWRVNQMASSRFGTQHSQAIAAYAVSKEKSTIPAAASA